LLVKAGLPERRPDQRDRRLRRMVVTEAGHDLVTKARPVIHSVERRMTASLDKADLARWSGP
jgi:DNA-binding MarR family transcriptional regulator